VIKIICLFFTFGFLFVALPPVFRFLWRFIYAIFPYAVLVGLMIACFL
jgi:hypothetical protein